VHARGDLAQQRVADVMPERVVDLLEAVEVEEEEGRAAGARVVSRGPVVRGRQRSGQAVEQQGAVGEAGQRVVERLVAQRLLGRGALGHVANIDDDTADGRVVQAHGREFLDGAPSPVLVAHPVGQRLSRTRRRAAGREVPPHAVPVIGVRERERDLAAQLVGA